MVNNLYYKAAAFSRLMLVTNANDSSIRCNIQLN